MTGATLKGFEARFSLISQVLKPAATKRTFDGHVGQLFTSFYQCFSFTTFETPSYLGGINFGRRVRVYDRSERYCCCHQSGLISGRLDLDSRSRACHSGFIIPLSYRIHGLMYLKCSFVIYYMGGVCLCG